MCLLISGSVCWQESAHAQHILSNYWSVLQTAAGQDGVDTKRHWWKAKTSCRAGRSAQQEAQCSRWLQKTTIPKIAQEAGKTSVSLQNPTPPSAETFVLVGAHCSFPWMTQSSKKCTKMEFTNSVSISQVNFLICVSPCSLELHYQELWSLAWMSETTMGTLTLCPTLGRQLCTSA